MRAVFLAFFSFTFLLLLTTPVLAQTAERKEVITVPKDKTIEEDYFAWGQRVNLSGTVNGDTYVGGSNILVDGTINGDLIVGGGTVNITGNISKNMRVAAGQVTVSGRIDGNVTAVGGNIDIQKNAEIAGSVTSASGNLNIYAPIGRGATIASGNVTIGNTVNGSITAAVGNITLTPTAQIQNDLTYYSSNKADIQNGAKIYGKTTQNLPQKINKQKQRAENLINRAKLAFSLVLFISSLFIGLLLTKLLPAFTQSVSDKIKKSPFKMFLLGLIAMILIPIVSFILLITVIGIPIAIILIFTYFAGLFIAKLFVSIALGQKILAKDKRAGDLFLALVAGLIIYSLLGIIPIIGTIIAFLVVPTGLGALILAKKDFYQILKSKKLL